MSEPLAIVGISCLFPKADDLQTYWANIKNGVDAITPIPIGTHWDAADYYIDTFKFTENLPYRNHPENEAATYLEMKQWETRWRVFWVNIKIANCVRDGVMVTIEKTKPTP